MFIITLVDLQKSTAQAEKFVNKYYSGTRPLWKIDEGSYIVEREPQEVLFKV